MFEKYDPGFLAAFIGVVVTCTFAFIFERISIIYRFSERLKILEDMVDRIVSMGTDSGVLLSELVQEASDMVKEGHNVPRFHLKKRYRKSKRMAKLILDIKERSLLSEIEIVIHQTGTARSLAADLLMLPHMDAAEEQAMAHTDAVEETAAAEEQAMAHTDAVEETAAAEEQEVVHTDAVVETAAAEEQAMEHTDGVEETAATEEQEVVHTDAVEETADAVEETAAAEEQEVVHTDAVEQTTGLPQRVGTRMMVAHMDAAYISLILRGIWPLIRRCWHIWMLPMAHTDAVAAAEEPEVVHTDAVEQTTIAEETGLRQRVRTREKMVLKVAIHDENCKRRAMTVVASVEGVESIAVDMKERKITVIGEADPVCVTVKLRKFVFTEVVSVGYEKTPEEK